MSGKFFQALRELRQGITLDELDSSVAELVASVKATNKAGELTLKLKFRPGKNGAKYLHIEDSVSVKTPKQDRADTIFFTTADNSLTKQDPDQRSLDLRPVGSGASPQFDPATGKIRAS